MRHAAPVLAIIAAFALTRAVAYALGVDFTEEELGAAVQNVDPELLRTRLVESVWNLHGQPPLYNLALGVVLKLSGASWAGVFQAAHVALGLVEVQAVYALARGFGIRRWTSATLAVLVALTPSLLLYENLLFYDHPTLVLLTLAALGLQRFATQPTLVRGLLFFSTAAALVLTRTLFQLWWLLAVLALVLLLCRARRAVLLAAALPVALVVGL